MRALLLGLGLLLAGCGGPVDPRVQRVGTVGTDWDNAPIEKLCDGSTALYMYRGRIAVVKDGCP